MAEATKGLHAFVAPSYGKEEGDDPYGKANREIAKLAVQLTLESCPDDILLFDGSVPVREVSTFKVGGKSPLLFITLGSGDPKKHESTVFLAEETLHVCKKKGITKITVLAVSPYYRRALRDFRKILEPEGIEVNGIRLEGDWFDPNSSQWWTRSQLRWQVYDGILMALPFFIYRRLTKWLA